MQKLSVLQNIYLYLNFSNIVYKLVVILFTIKLYARNSVFKKYGHLRKARRYCQLQKIIIISSYCSSITIFLKFCCFSEHIPLFF